MSVCLRIHGYGTLKLWSYLLQSVSGGRDEGWTEKILSVSMDKGRDGQRKSCPCQWRNGVMDGQRRFVLSANWRDAFKRRVLGFNCNYKLREKIITN